MTCLNKELLLLLLKLAAGCVVIMTFIVIACLITPKIARFIEKRHPELAEKDDPERVRIQGMILRTIRYRAYLISPTLTAGIPTIRYITRISMLLILKRKRRMSAVKLLKKTTATRIMTMPE